MSDLKISRRVLLGGLTASVAGCDQVGENPEFQRVLFGAEALNLGAQRLLTNRSAPAREYRRDQISPIFKTNGSTMPASPAYQAHMASNFADWRLLVDGLVTRPLALSLAQLVQMPRRTQITRHDCVEGWSAIGEWTGVPLKLILDAAGLRDGARYIVFHCADDSDGSPYYESIDRVDAFHPQTIMAYGMNGARLPVAYGAPVRLRVERMLGYKHAKYVMRIEARETLAGLYGGKGGFWEDHSRYEWYAGL